MPERLDRIRQCHFISGLLIALFTAAHLLNLAAAVSGPAGFDNLRTLLRVGYHHPLYETLLLAAPILINLVTGLSMLRMRPMPHDAAAPRGVVAGARHSGGFSDLRRRLHRLSGIGLAALLPPHILATRGLDLFGNVDTGFYFVAGTLAGLAAPVFLASYALLVLAAAFHLSNGMFTYLDEAGSFPGPVSRRGAAAVFLLVGTSLALCGAIALLSFGGVLYPRPTVEPLPLTHPSG